MPRYVPGARGAQGTTPIKVSSNENPYDPLPSVAAAIARAALAINRYPDMFCTELGALIAERHGVTAERVVVGAGSVALLGHAIQAFCGPSDEVVYAWRSFEAYPILTQIAGAQPVRVPLGSGARHDLPALAAAVGPATRVVLVCSPNNPTGPAVGAAEFEAFMEALPPTILVVLDEAYGEFVRDPGAVKGLDVLTLHPNVLVIRTFSKAYGLAGLRVGYGMGHPDVVAAIRACVTPFSVSGVAQAAAVASLAAEAELLERVEEIVAERDRLLNALREQGWSPPDAQGNFFWIPAGTDADALAAYLMAGDPPILARPFSGEGVRITVGSVAENDAVLRLLASYPSRF